MNLFQQIIKVKVIPKKIFYQTLLVLCLFSIILSACEGSKKDSSSKKKETPPELPTQPGKPNSPSSRNLSVLPQSLQAWAEQTAKLSPNISGTAISTLAELKAIVLDDESVAYHLTHDIDLSSESNWSPLGAGSRQGFKGSLYGNGYVIYGLQINRSDQNDQGLFSRISGAKIENLGVGIIKITGQALLGGIISYAYDSVLDNLAVGPHDPNQSEHIEGSKSGSMYNNLGAVVGHLNSSSLVGYNFGVNLKMADSSSDGDGSGRVGGLVGNLVNSSLKGSATTQIQGDKTSMLGGLAGKITRNSGSVNVEGIAQGQITLTNSEGSRSMVGGLVGYVDGHAEVKGISDIAVKADHQQVGGLVGYLKQGSALGVSAGSITGTSTSNSNDYGGLVGETKATVEGYSLGYVMAEGNNTQADWGCAIGKNDGGTSNTYCVKGNGDTEDHVGETKTGANGKTGETSGKNASLTYANATSGNAGDMSKLTANKWSFVAGKLPKPQMDQSVFLYHDFELIIPTKPANYTD